MSARKDVAVVILNYNGAHYLRQFLKTVIAYSPEADIIVIDNASQDDSSELLKSYPEVRCIQLAKNYGFCGGYNKGLEQVSAKYYVLLNSDVEVSPNWLAAPLKTLKRDSKIAVCQPKIRSYHKRTHFEYAGAAGGYLDYLGYPFAKGRIMETLEKDSGQYETETPIFWASGAAFFVKAELYQRLGGFDETFFAHMEEIDLCWRLQLEGYRIYYSPDSVVYHVGGGTLDTESPRKVYFNFRNSLFTLVKNRTLPELIWTLPLRLVLDGLGGLHFILKNKSKHCLAIIRAHLSFYRYFLQMYKCRSAKPIALNKLEGVYKGSIIWAYFGRSIKSFKRLKITKS